MNQTNIETRSVADQNEEPGIAEFSEAESYGPLTFAQFLHTVRSCPNLLSSLAKNHLLRARYQKALSLWQERGFPHPGDWPDNDDDPMDVLPYMRQWLTQQEAALSDAELTTCQTPEAPPLS